MLPGYLTPTEGTHTTHFSIIDAEGNLVSGTQTVNLTFGSRVRRRRHRLRAQRRDGRFRARRRQAECVSAWSATTPTRRSRHSRPLSSMTPSFVVGARSRRRARHAGRQPHHHDGAARASSRSSTASRRQQFVANPRYHHQYLPDVISAEQGALSAGRGQGAARRWATPSATARAPWGFMNAVSWDRKTGKMHARRRSARRVRQRRSAVRSDPIPTMPDSRSDADRQ